MGPSAGAGYTNGPVALDSMLDMRAHVLLATKLRYSLALLLEIDALSVRNHRIFVRTWSWGKA